MRAPLVVCMVAGDSCCIKVLSKIEKENYVGCRPIVRYVRNRCRSDLIKCQMLYLVRTKNIRLFALISFYSAYRVLVTYTAHELAHLSIAQALKAGADELSRKARALKTCADEPPPIAQALKTCGDELSPITQALKTCEDELPPIAQAGEHMCSSCSSCTAHLGGR